MPVAPTYPGVYIEEVPSGVRTITGVATSITAFFGQAKEGPVNKAVRILSFADFERNFGPPHPKSEMSTAVRLFFQNGGTDGYVVRLVKSGSGSKASLVVKNAASAPIDVLKFTAKEIGVWGNEIVIEVDYNTANPEDTFHLRIYRIAAGGTIKTTEEYLNCSMDNDSSRFVKELINQNSTLVDCELTFANDAAYEAAAPDAGYSESRRPFAGNQTGRNELAGILAAAQNTSQFKISVDNSPFSEVNLVDAFASGANEATVLSNITTKINDALPPALKNSVDVSFENGPGTLKVLRFTSKTTEKKSVVIQPVSDKDVTGTLMLGTDQGGIEPSRYAVLRPAPSGTFFTLSKLNDLTNLKQDDFDKLEIDEKIEKKEINLGTKLHTKPPPNTSRWYETATNFDGVREKLAILTSEINDASIGWTAKVAGYRLLLSKRQGLNNFSAPLTTDGTPDATYFIANTRLYALGSGVGTYHGAKVSGVDGDPPDIAAYKGSDANHTGFYALDLVDLFNLMVIPRDSNLSEDDYRSLWGPASAYCAEHRAFLIIDPPDSWWKSYANVTNASKGIRKLRIGVVKDHAAVFYPRIVVRENGLQKKVGPGGAIAGLMSKTDSERGVWKAPAGTEADIIGISGVEINITDPENGVLNKEGVNCLRLFPVGIVNWGSRTMDGADDFGSEWKYIPIRRLALFIEESLFRGTKWVVFEPNDEPLWAKIRMNVGAFMKRLFRQGAFQGDTPDKAYFVKCDGETTIQADRNLGIVNIIVGFAPLKPAEFVIIKIQQIPGEL
jgi:uncharacterized protein